MVLLLTAATPLWIEEGDSLPRDENLSIHGRTLLLFRVGLVCNRHITHIIKFKNT
jgi:hypothetical protein